MKTIPFAIVDITADYGVTNDFSGGSVAKWLERGTCNSEVPS